MLLEESEGINTKDILKALKSLSIIYIIIRSYDISCIFLSDQ